MKWNLMTNDSAEKEMSWLKLIGFILLVSGIANIFYFILFYSSSELQGEGGRIALIFLMIMLGLILTFPSFLTEDGTTMSSMRLISFIIITAFIMVVIKIGWDAKSFDSLKIDASWMGVIGLAFGAKAAQRFFERKSGTKGKAGA